MLKTQMRKNVLMNLLILALVGALGYGLTHILVTAPPAMVNPADTETNNITSNKGASLPDFTFTDTEGNTHDFHDFAGKTIVLNFWVSWCAPCIKEFPLLIEAARANPDDLVLIALSSDISAEPMMRFVDKLDIRGDNIIVALDTDQQITRGLFQTYRLPETLIISPALEMCDKLVGAAWSAEDLAALIADCPSEATP